jgi:hypothetical protein
MVIELKYKKFNNDKKQLAFASFVDYFNQLLFLLTGREAVEFIQN